jgi:hypothetical protein
MQAEINGLYTPMPFVALKKAQHHTNIKKIPDQTM